MHWIAVVQIVVTDTAQYHTKHHLYYCDLSIYIIPYLTSFFFFFPKRGMANGHKETSLQRVTLACGNKPNGICLSTPLHSANSLHLLPLPVQAQVRSVQTTTLPRRMGSAACPAERTFRLLPKD